MITVYLNGKSELTAAATLSEFLRATQYVGNYFAVAINEIFIPREHYDHQALKESDRIDIVAPMQGG